MMYAAFKKFAKHIWLLVALIGFITPSILASDLEVDDQAPASKQPEIEVHNSVPIINITEPSPGGVSHNIFREYNVTEKGIVFNNNSNQQPDLNQQNISVLAKDPLFINDKLGGRAAEIILAEVSGNNISKLLGLTEIYGQGADFILANPNGIYCNGAGFINAHRVTLTTGRPQLDYAGVIRSLQVDRGTIEIHDKGLSIPLSENLGSPVEILSRTVKISGTLSIPRDLYIYTGLNKFDYNNKKLDQETNPTSSTSPYLAIDGALVGEIGARKITIIATEQGVGVNCPPLKADADNIEITADGNIQLKTIKTVGDLLVTSKSGNIEQEAETNIAQKGCKLEAKQGTILLSTQEFKVNDSTQFSSKQLTLSHQTKLWVGKNATNPVSLTLNIQEKIDNQGNIYVPKFNSSPLQSFMNSGELITQHDLTLESQSIHNQGSICVEAGACNLTGHLEICNKNLLHGKQGLILTTQKTLNNSDRLVSGRGIHVQAYTFEQQGQVVADGLVQVTKTNRLVNKGNIHAKQKIELQANHLNNSGSIYSQANIEIKATYSTHNQGSLKSVELLDLTTAKLYNEGSLISEAGNVSLDVKEELTNKKLILGQKQVHIQTAGTVNNHAQMISKAGLEISAKKIENTGKLYSRCTQQLNVQEALINKNVIHTSENLTIETPHVKNEGILSAKQQLIIHAKKLKNKREINTLAGAGHLVIEQKFINRKDAKIIIQKDLVLEVNNQAANYGELTAHQSLEASIKGTFNNRGSVKVAQQLTINANQLDNSQELSTEKGDMKLHVTRGLTNQKDAKITSGKNLELHATKVTNQGHIKAQEKLDLAINELTNQGDIQGTSCEATPFQKIYNQGNLQVEADLKLTSNHFHNLGTVTSPAGQLNVTVHGILINEKDLYSKQDLTLQVDGALTNKGLIHADGSQQITAASLKNTANIITKGKNSTLKITQQLTNNGKIETQGTHIVEAGEMTNQGTIASQSYPLTLQIKEKLANTGYIYSPTQLMVTAGELTNESNILSGGVAQLATTKGTKNTGALKAEKDLHLQAQLLTNQGTLASIAGKLRLKTPDQLINQGSLESAHRLTIHTDRLFNQVGGKITTDQKLCLKNKKLQQITNLGAVKAYSLRHAGIPAMDNVGTIEVEEDLTLTTESLHQSGTIQVTSGNLTITSETDIHNDPSALLSSAQSMHLQAKKEFINQGDVLANAHLDLRANSLHNEGRILGGSTTINCVGNISNTQQLASKSDLSMIIRNALINKGVVSAYNNLHVEALKVENTKEISTQAGHITLGIAQTLANEEDACINSAIDLTIQAQGTTNQGYVIAGTSLVAKIMGKLQNKGIMKAEKKLTINTNQLNNAQEISTKTGDIKLHAAQALTNQQFSKITSGKNLELHATAVTNNGTINTQGKLDLQIKEKLENTGYIHSPTQLMITAGELTNESKIISAQELEIAAKEALTNYGKIAALGHTLTVMASSIVNKGELSGHDVALTSTAGKIKNTKLIGSKGGDLDLTTPGTFINKEHLIANRHLTLHAGNVLNKGQITSQTGKTQLTISQDLTNQTGAQIASSSNCILHSTNLDNAGVISVPNNLDLKVDHLTNQGRIGASSLTSTSFQTIHNEGLLKVASDMILMSGSLSNKEGVIGVEAGKLTLTIDGALLNQTKNKLVDLKSSKKEELQPGTIYAQEAQDITAGSLDNQGQVCSLGPITLETENQALNTGIIHTAQMLKLKSGTTLDNEGSITAQDGATVTAKNKLTNTANLSSNRTIHVESQSGEIENKGSITAKSHTTLKAHGDITQAGQLTSREKLEIVTDNNLNNTGVIHPGKELHIQAKNITNTKSIETKTASINLHASEKIKNSHHIVSEAGNVALAAKELENQKGGVVSSGSGLTLNVPQIINQKEATLSSSKQLKLLNVSKLTNAGNIEAFKLELEHTNNPVVSISNVDNIGRIKLQDHLTLQSQSFTNSGELILVQGDLRITSQIDLTILKGSMITQQGDLHLTATTGKLHNLGGVLFSHQNMSLTAQGEIENKQLIKAKQNLTIQAHSLQNLGEIVTKQGTTTIKKLSGKLLNTNKIQSAGSLILEGTTELTNKGKLSTGGKLCLKANYLDNQDAGHIEAQEGKITVDETLTNKNKINSVTNLTIEAGRLTNRNEIQANQTLTITTKKGNLDNYGILSSERGSGTITVVGTLKNDKAIKSYLNLTLKIGRLENNDELRAEQKLSSEAQSIDNRGAIVGSAGVELNTKQGDLSNSNLIGTRGDLILRVRGQLKNIDKGQILQGCGKLTLTAHSLHNTANINFSPTNQQGDIQINDFIYNTGSIKSRGSLGLKVSRHIENKGTIVTEQNLVLSAPIIKHVSDAIQSNQGNVNIQASNYLENAGVLNAPKGTLSITTNRLDNQTDLKLDNDLILNIQHLDNSRTIAAKGAFQLTELQTFINRSGGVLAGGEGDNKLVVASKLENYGKIFTKGSLDIQATQVNVLNQGKLAARGSLTLYAKNLWNNDLVQGGGATSLTIAEKITNNGQIASTSDLDIKAHKIGLNASNSRSTPLIQANRHISLQVTKLSGNDIQGGKGDTRIEVDGLYKNHNLISSAGNLYIMTKGCLINEPGKSILAGSNLNLEGKMLINNSGACIRGGDGITRLKGTFYITNDGTFSSNKDLILETDADEYGGYVSNTGSIQAINKLQVITSSFNNQPQKNVFAGGNLHIQANHIENKQGTIFTNQHMILEGQQAGQHAEKVSNITDDYEARIEAMGDITIRAKELENKGKKSSSSNYYTNTRSVGSPGNGTYAVTHAKDVISTMTTKPAYIQSGDKLHLDIIENGVNYGGVIICGKNMTVKGRSIENIRPSEEVYISDYYRYEKKWTTKEVSGGKVVAAIFTLGISAAAQGVSNEIEHSDSHYSGKTVTIPSTNGPIFRSGETMQIDAKELKSGISISSVNVAPTASPVAELEKKSGVISTLSSIQLPQGEYGMFKLQQDPHADPTPSASASTQVKVTEMQLPTFDAPSLLRMDTHIDSSLTQVLAPRGPAFDERGKIVEEDRMHMGFNEEEIEAFPTYTPATDVASNPSATSSNIPSRTGVDFTQRASTTTTRNRAATLGEQPIEGLPSYIPPSIPNSQPAHVSRRSQATNPGAPDYTIPDNPSISGAGLAGEIPTHEPAPPQEEIKNNFSPPLIVSNVPVDQSKFYGSPYFARHVGIDPNKPLRFLGDPFYESRLINDAIYKQTSRVFLYEDVATPEQQVKCLIDNTATVHKDLKLSLGIALSKEQINSLKKDILWYVEEEVVGQKVLVPQIYLTQSTIDHLKSGKGTGLYSRGDMHLNVQGALTNTGNIHAGGNQTIRAESLHNESFGNTQAVIGAKGVVDLETKKDIKNISGKIVGEQGGRVVSTEGQIFNQTKLLNESTLHMQASIESGGDLVMQAKGDIINQAGKIKAVGDGTMVSETGDIKNLTQTVKRSHTEMSSSQKDGFWSSESTSHTSTHTSTQHAVSSIDIGKNLTMKARDITFMGTDVKVGKKAHLEAKRDFKALAVQDMEETSRHTESSTQESGLFSSSSSSSSQSSYHKKVTSKGPNFIIGEDFNVIAGGDADFEGANVDAGNVKMEIQGKTTLRAAYDEETFGSSSSSENKNEALFGLIKDNKGQSNSSKSYDKTATGNVWKVRDKMEIIGKQDVVTEGIDVTAHTIHLESTQGNVSDKAAEEIHQYTQTDSKYKDKQGLLGFKTQGEQGRLGLKLKKKKEDKSTIENNKVTGKSSSFKTISRTVIKEDGTKQEIAGNATFKAAKKVSLEATEADIQGKLSLQGTEGVEVIAKKETEHTKEHREHYEEELSLGIKNSIAAAAYQAKGVKEATEKLMKANADHNSYRTQRRQAQKLLEKGEITKAEYDEVAAEEEYHLAAISLATLDLAAKSKQFISSVGQAVTTAGSSLGFSVDLQGDINKTVEDFMNYTETAKGSKLRTKELEIITEGTLKVSGSEIKSETTSIEAQDVLVESFKGASINKNNSRSQGGNVTIDLAPSATLPISGISASLNHEQTTGGSQGIKHTHSMLDLGATKLNIKKDVHIIGGQVKTSTLTGEVGGNVHIETVVDKQEGSQNKVGANVGLNMGLIGGGLGSLGQSMGGGYGHSEESSNWVEKASELSSTGAMHLKIGGKTKLKGVLS